MATSPAERRAHLWKVARGGWLLSFVCLGAVVAFVDANTLGIGGSWDPVYFIIHNAVADNNNSKAEMQQVLVATTANIYFVTLYGFTTWWIVRRSGAGYREKI